MIMMTTATIHDHEMFMSINITCTRFKPWPVSRSLYGRSSSRRSCSARHHSLNISCDTSRHNARDCLSKYFSNWIFLLFESSAHSFFSKWVQRKTGEGSFSLKELKQILRWISNGFKRINLTIRLGLRYEIRFTYVTIKHQWQAQRTPMRRGY